MCVMIFLASTPTHRESKCTPSVISWSALMFLLSMNPQCLHVVIEFSSSLALSTFFRSGCDWYCRCMMDEMVTGVAWRVSIQFNSIALFQTQQYSMHTSST